MVEEQEFAENKNSAAGNSNTQSNMAAGYSVQDIAFELNRTGNTVRRMIYGFYDNLEPKKPKEKDKEKPLWQVCFETEWENTVNRIRKAMGKEPI